MFVSFEKKDGLKNKIRRDINATKRIIIGTKLPLNEPLLKLIARVMRKNALATMGASIKPV